MDLEHGFKLGNWIVRPRQSLLVRGDVRRRIEPKVMAVLVCLSRHAPETATRRELFDEVWAGVVVQDEVLSRNVSILRASLLWAGEDREFIQTVPRVGYRLLELPSPLAEPIVEKPITPTLLEGRIRRPWRLGLVSVLLVGFFALVASLLGAERNSRKPVIGNATSLSAQLILAGYDSAQRRGADYLHSSIRLFRDALRNDPTAIEARLGIANALALLPSYEPGDSEVAFAEALTELKLYVDAGGSVGRTHATAAFIQLHRLKFTQAELRFREAIAFDPKDASVRQYYSQLLGSVGRVDEAVAQAELALELDPNSAVNHHRLAIAYVWAGENARATRLLASAKLAGIAPFVNPEPRIILYFRSGQFEEFFTLLRVLQESRALDAAWIADLEVALTVGDSGVRDRAIDAVRRAWDDQQVDPSLYFGVPLFLGDTAAAIEAAIALTGRGEVSSVIEGFFLPEAEALRARAEFFTLAEELGLVSYWRSFGLPDVCREPLREQQLCARIEKSDHGI